MSTFTRYLNELIGGQALGDHLSAAIRELQHRTGASYAEVCDEVTERLDAGDPAILAATRQTWVRRGSVATMAAPHARLRILERTQDGVFVVPLDPSGAQHTMPPGDECAVDGGGFDASLDLLANYELTAWQPFEHFLPTCGSLSDVRPGRDGTS